MKILHKPVTQALILSDLHLGWTICGKLHRKLLKNIHHLADKAELIVLNGDIIDYARRVFSSSGAGRIQFLKKLIEDWKKAGKEVVYIEGNHDLREHADAGFMPDCATLDFRGVHNERIRIFHGHNPQSPAGKRYDTTGTAFLALDNYIFAKIPLLRPLMRLLFRRIYGLIARVEDRMNRQGMTERCSDLASEVDILIHGHMHFGPSSYSVDGTPVYRSGSWVSPGQAGTANTMLRYNSGTFEHIALVDGEWRARPMS